MFVYCFTLNPLRLTTHLCEVGPEMVMYRQDPCLYLDAGACVRTMSNSTSSQGQPSSMWPEHENQRLQQSLFGFS